MDDDKSTRKKVELDNVIWQTGGIRIYVLIRMNVTNVMHNWQN
jgi:hypothetical protein